MTNPPQFPHGGVQLPQAPPPRPGRALWWVLGFIIVFLLLILAGGIFLATHIVRDVTVKGPNEVELHTRAGEVSIHKTDEDTTGLPVYPGATQSPEGARIQFEPSHEEASFSLSAASYFSSDDLEKVASWYRQNLDSRFREEKKATVHVGRADVGHADIAFVSKEEGRLRIVALERRDGQTKITLVRMGKQQAQ